jgi:hypothetical protein
MIIVTNRRRRRLTTGHGMEFSRQCVEHDVTGRSHDVLEQFDIALSSAE